ncbi:MAG: DegT/DnrJ/EryC1/StrS aminotransferase family protein [Magnetococcus sp. WYHC-3]
MSAPPPFPTWPHYGVEEQEAVARVLASGRVNYHTGSLGREFESRCAAAFGAPHAVAVANGSVALELALLALDIGHGDKVVVTPRSFVASVSAVVRVGAQPVFADVHPDSGNITAESVQKVLAARPRAVLVVHLAGWPADMPDLMTLAREHDLRLIEDCAQAHGARVNGRPVGSWGDAAAFSFCTEKILSTGGEGGMVLLQDQEAYQRAWSFKDHGKDFHMAHAPCPPATFPWMHQSFGTNWRLTEMQSAIGLVQLPRLAAWMAQRQANARHLAQGLAPLAGVRVPWPGDDRVHAWYKFTCYVRPERLQPSRQRDWIQQRINAAGIPCRVGGCGEIYREGAFDGHPSRPAAPLPVAQRLAATSLQLEVHPRVDAPALSRMVDVVAAAVTEATLPEWRR